MDQVHFAREGVAVEAVLAGGVEVELNQFVLLAVVKDVGAKGWADFDRVAVVHDGVLFIAR